MSTLPEDNAAQAGPIVTEQAKETGVLAQVEHFVEGLLHPDAEAKVESDAQAGELKDPLHEDSMFGEKFNTGAALAEQTEAFKRPVIGASQAGNAMDTMHGKVNSTWPPKAR